MANRWGSSGNNDRLYFIGSYQLEDFLTQEQISVINKQNVWSKEKLAKKIVDHFYFRESAYETPRNV